MYKRLPSLDDIGIKEAEVYSEQTAEFLSVRSPTPDVIGSSNSAVTQDVIPPVQVATPIVQSVKVVTRTGGGISGPAGGDIADEQIKDKQIGALVAMRLRGDMAPTSDEVQTESELTKKLLLGCKT